MGDSGDVSAIEVVGTDPASVGRAADLLRAGGLVAFPTETVYGLGAAVDHPEALRRVFSAKGRPTEDPLIAHVADVDAARDLAGVWPGVADELAGRCWPGPLTLVVTRPPGLDDLVCAGGPTVGVRVPAPATTRALLAAVGTPVAAPSANRFGRISPTAAAHVVAEFSGPDVADRPDLVLDGGPCPLGVESTVVDVTGSTPVVLRPGGIAVEDLRAWIGTVEVRSASVAPSAGTGPLRSPGEYVAHYSPARPLVLLDAPRGTAARVAGLANDRGRSVTAVDLPDDAAAAAQVLYGRLRELDRPGEGPLLVDLVDPTGLGRAVNDRLYRAAHGRLVVAEGDVQPETVLAAVEAAVGR